MVGRSFWPHGNVDSAGHLMELATGLHTAGTNVAVATAKYAASWADQFTFREFPVFRPVRIFRTGWAARGDRSASRYIRNLRQWIESNSFSADVIYCNGSREEAIAVIEAASNLELPAVVRLAGHGQTSDLAFFDDTRVGKRCRAAVAKADAIVVSDAATERGWISSGGSSENVCRIPIGIGQATNQEPIRTSELRRALAQINGDLFVPDACNVVLSVERMQEPGGIMTLVNAAYGLTQHVPHLQFWLTGDGPARDTIYNHLKSDGLRQMVAMPGSFGALDDLFQAADLVVHAGDEGFDHQIPAAIAAGIPLVLANRDTARRFFDVSDADVGSMILDSRHASQPDPRGQQTRPGEWVWWFDDRRPKTLRFAIAQIVGGLDVARQRAALVRKWMLRHRSQRQSIDQYTSLFSRLANPSPTESPIHSSREQRQ